MIVKFRGAQSTPQNLIGGGPQGTLLGGLQYIISSDDCLQDKVDQINQFKYFDDLNIMEFIFLSEFLIDYPVMEHMPSDVGMNQLFLPPSRFDMQNSLNDIAECTNYNLIVCFYILSMPSFDVT